MHEERATQDERPNTTRRVSIAFLALLPLLGAVAACDDVDARQLKERGAEALERFQAERGRVEQDLEQRLGELNTRMVELRRELEAEGEERLEGLMGDLEAQREVARAKLAELRATGVEAWDRVLEDAERELETFRERTSEALSGD